MEQTKQKTKRRMRGTVVSDKMAKTVVVEVLAYKKHPKYQKYRETTKRFKAHDENQEFHAGDQVVIEETRPMSREKRWKVVELIKKADQQEAVNEE